IIGAVYSALPFEPAKNNYQGYINVNLIYDQRLKISSPPGFPIVKPLSANKSFEVVYWKDITALGIK
ncbi:MAG: hypothetical protein HYU63_06235, partial [Armatimonadetes bacterium]|nr:hypothetical protein [Armatimonadota bacterium]